MSRYHTPAEKASAVARVVEGGERPAAVARSLGIDESTLRQWRKAAGGPRAPKSRPAPAGIAQAPAAESVRTVDVPATVIVEGPAPDAAEAAPGADPGGTAPGAAPSANAPDGASERLRRAFEAAGVKGEPSPNGQHASGAAKEAPPDEPPPTPAQLILLLEVILFLSVRGVAAGKDRQVTDAQLSDLSRFRADEREMLELLAPYACPYVPQIMRYLKAGAALCFVGVWGLAVAARVKEIERMPQRNPPPNAPPRAPDPKPTSATLP